MQALSSQADAHRSLAGASQEERYDHVANHIAELDADMLLIFGGTPTGIELRETLTRFSEKFAVALRSLPRPEVDESIEDAPVESMAAAETTESEFVSAESTKAWRDSIDERGAADLSDASDSQPATTAEAIAPRGPVNEPGDTVSINTPAEPIFSSGDSIYTDPPVDESNAPPAGNSTNSLAVDYAASPNVSDIDV